MIGSLFSGIGGLELGLECAGLGPVAWQVEIDPFCRLVLEKHWPTAKRFEDVRSVGAAELASVDIICGGFPCQDVSGAGRGAGLTGARSGLWSEYARIVSELQPQWVVVENVTSGATRWLDQIVRELELIGYECLPVPLSARDVGAFHLRRRIFVIAHRRGVNQSVQPGRRLGENRTEAVRYSCSGAARGIADVDSKFCEPRESGARSKRGGWPESGGGSVAYRDGQRKLQSEGSEPEQWGRSQDCPSVGDWGSPKSDMAPVVHGVSGGLAGRQRRRRIRALGNSVVPQCAEVVGWMIRELAANCGGARVQEKASER